MAAISKNMFWTIAPRLYPNNSNDIYAWIYTTIVLSIGIGPLYGGAIGE